MPISNPVSEYKPRKLDYYISAQTLSEPISNDVKDLKVILNDLKAENREIKAEVKLMEKKLSDMNERNNNLENRINHLEQHHRGWSARVLNVPLTQEEENGNIAVINKVYELVRSLKHLPRLSHQLI
jgi:chromosome segregation ATPase